MRFLSIKYIKKFVTNYFYKKIHVEQNLKEIFSKYKPDLVIYPTHSKRARGNKNIKKLSDIYNLKLLHN